MSWALWLWVGLTIGSFAGVALMCLLIIARDPGPPPNLDDDGPSA